MATVVNHALERLRAGELALGVGLRQARTVDTGKIMRTCGFDWLFVDMEHNTMSIDTAVQICVAAQDAGITPLVRVPGFQHFTPRGSSTAARRGSSCPTSTPSRSPDRWSRPVATRPLAIAR